MAHIAYLATKTLSHLNSSLGLCEQLASRGHEITYLSPIDYSNIVETHGFRFVHLKSFQKLKEQSQLLLRPRNPLSFVRWFRKKRALRLTSLRSTEIEDSLNELKIDLQIIDTEFHCAIISSQALSSPTFLHQIFFCYQKSNRNPPLNSSLIPTPENQKTIDSAWNELEHETKHLNSPKFRKTSLTQYLRIVDPLTSRLSDLKAFAKAKNFSLRKETTTTNFLRPFSYNHLPILSTSLRELEFLNDFPSNFHHIGPLFGSRFSLKTNSESLLLWNEFKQRHLFSSSSPTLIYVTLGSFWATDLDFLQRLITAFKNRPEWSLVIGLGNQSIPSKLEPLPENVLALDWAPQQEILPLCQCALIHCGASSIYECLYHGVPILGYSGKEVDQNGNAARLQFHKIALLGDKDIDSSSDIENKIAATLADSEIKKNTLIFRDHILRHHQNQTVATTVERLLEKSTY